MKRLVVSLLVLICLAMSGWAQVTSPFALSAQPVVATACRVIQIVSLLGVRRAAELYRAILCAVRLVGAPRWCSAILDTSRHVFC